MKRINIRAAGAVVLGASAAASAAPVYQLTDLTTLFGAAGAPYVPRSINNSGMIAGTYDAPPAGGFNNSWIYDGTFHDMGSLAGGAAEVLDLNDAGQAVGFVVLNNGDELRAFRYDYATRSMTALGPVAGSTRTLAAGINNRGQVVGNYLDTSGAVGPTIKPVRWDNGVATPLPTLSPIEWGSAGRVNDAAVFTGSYDVTHIDHVVSRAVIYRDNVPTDIGTLGGPSAAAVDINQAGQVIGNSETGDGQTHAFLYRDGVMTDLGTLGARSIAWGLNDAGVGVGDSLGLSASNLHATIYQDGAAIDLNTLVDTENGRWELISARDINNAGQIVGAALYHTGPLEPDQVRAFVLTPVPEPTSAGALAAVAGAALLRRRRRPATRAKPLRPSFSPRCSC